MSKDHLEQLLDKLVAEDNASVSELQRCYQLDREFDHLYRRVESPREIKHKFDHSVSTLKGLLDNASFNKAMALLEYPTKLLKGDIDLLSPAQHNAISELSVTLANDSRIETHILEITQALKLFYEEFYKDGDHPPELDKEAEHNLNAFEADPERGAWPPYKSFVDYNRRLQQVDAEELRPEELEKNKPEFFSEIHSRQLLEATRLELKEHLLLNTPWEGRHVEILEHFFQQEEEEKLLMITIDIIESDLGGVKETFIDEQLRDESKSDILLHVLENKSDEQLQDMVISSLNKNLDRLLSTLINIIGFDQSYFYQVLAKKGVGTDVYKKIIESLFLQNTAGGTYGMDGNYAEKLMNEHISIPQNVIQTLQKAMPRGFDGHPLGGYFDFMKTINSEVERLREKKEKLSEMKLKDREYCDHVLLLSDIESIRFIVFVYIFDSLKGGIFPAKTGMSRKKVAEKLSQQYEFEQKVGRNRNIVDHIEKIWDLHPDVRLSTPVDA